MTTTTLDTPFTPPTYRTSSEDVLKKGLGAMTIACEQLTKQNEQLNKDIINLKQKLRSSEEKVMMNLEDKE